MNYRGTLRQRIQHSHNIETGTIKVWFNVHDTEEMGQKENSLPHVILRKILTWHAREPVQKSKHSERWRNGPNYYLNVYLITRVPQI